jgi:transposase
MAYDIEFRRQVLESAKECNDGVRGAAKKFRVSATTIENWKKLFRETGGLGIRHANSKKKNTNPKRFRQKIEESPGMLQREPTNYFKICRQSIWQILKKFGYKRKKSDFVSGKD